MKQNIIPFVEVVLQCKPIVKVMLRTKETPCKFYQMIFFKNNKNIGVMTCETLIPSIQPTDVFTLTSLAACISIDPYPEEPVVIHEVNAKEFLVPKDLTVGSKYVMDFTTHEIKRVL